MKQFFLLFLAVGLVAGCKTKSSSELATNEIRAGYGFTIADDAPTTTTMSAIFDRNLTTKVVLADGDSITVRTDKGDFPLPTGPVSNYYLQQDTIVDATTASFDLVHGGTTTSSTIAVPRPMTFTSTANPSVAYGDGNASFTLTWSDPDPATQVVITPSPCDGASTIVLPAQTDTGSYTFTTKSIVVGAPTASQCIKLGVTRKIDGTPSTELAPNSTISSSRLKYFQLTLVP